MFELYRKVIKPNFQYYTFILIALLLPFHKAFLPYLMALWVFSGLINIRKIDLSDFKNKPLLVLPLILYLLLFIGLFYSKNTNKTLFDLQVKLTILFISPVIVFMSNKVLLNFKTLLKLFILGNFVASIVCLIYGLSNSIQIDPNQGLIFNSCAWPNNETINSYTFFQLVFYRYSFLSYNFLSVFHHPTYYSVYIMFSIVSLVYLIGNSEKRKLGYFLLIGYFTLFLLLLGSRAVLLTYIISIIFYFAYLILKLKLYKVLGIITLLITTFIIIIFINDKIKAYLSESINTAKEQNLSKDSDMRLWLWKSGVEVFKEEFWFGTGTGDIREELKKKYKKYGLETAHKNNYNVHNQYLDIAVKLGVLGFTVFLFWMIYAFIISITRRQFLFFFFLLIMFVNFFFEVMLNSIAGVSFFAFFYSLLYAKYNIKQESV